MAAPFGEKKCTPCKSFAEGALKIQTCQIKDGFFLFLRVNVALEGTAKRVVDVGDYKIGLFYHPFVAVRDGKFG